MSPPGPGSASAPRRRPRDLPGGSGDAVDRPLRTGPPITPPVDGGVTLRQLGYFAAVAELGSFTAAATELHVAQPSLSQQVRTLEQVAGGRLLERGPRGVRPTAAGELLLPKARAALEAAGDGMELARREIRQPGSICLTVTAGAPSAILATAIARWREARPGAEVQWVELPTALRILEKVAAGPSVVGICAAVDPWPGAVEPLTREPLVLARPAGGIRRPEELLLVRNGHEHLLPAAADRQAIHVADAAGAVALVRAGTALAVLPRGLASVDGVHAEEIPGAPSISFSAFASPTPTAAAAEMLRLLGEEAARRRRPEEAAAA